MKNCLFLLLFVSFFLLNSACTNDLIEVECTPAESITDKTSFDTDQKLLSTWLEDIQNSAGSMICEDASKWKFTELGAKACGGPAGYIAYNSENEAECFLKKVEHFNSQSKIFNEKHGIISDCSLAIPPKAVVCENGKPGLVYE